MDPVSADLLYPVVFAFVTYLVLRLVSLFM